MRLIQSMTLAASMAIAVGVPVSNAAPVSPATKQTQRSGPAKAPAIPKLKGNVLYSSNWTLESQPSGIYYVPTQESETFEMIVPHEQGRYSGTFGNFEQGGYYFTSERVKNDGAYIVAHTVRNASDGKFVNSFVTEDCSQVAIDCDNDPSSKFTYAATFNSTGDGYQLSVLDFSKTSATSMKIGDFDCEIAALAFDPKGQLYAISRDRNGEGTVVGSTLLKVDKGSAKYTKIGTGTGFKPSNLCSAAIDPKSGRMFWTMDLGETSGLYEVDLSTGKASLVYTYPDNEQVVGLMIAGQAAEDKAPAAPTDLKTQFDGGSLSGQITFKVPATTFDGQAASGNVSYTVAVDGTTQKTGTAAYGSNVICDLSVSSPGEHTFTVQTSNSSGASPKTNVKAYIGFGIPSAPATVRAQWADGTATVSWDAVTTATDGGYINPSDITYTLTRADGTTAGQNLKATTFSEPLPVPAEPTSYTYMVTALNGDRKSEAAASNTIALGTITPPFESAFSDGEQTLKGYTIIDANKDGRTWTWDAEGKGVRASYNTDHQTPMDDWLITPGLDLKAGHVYDLAFDSYVKQADCEETFEVMMGNANTAEAMAARLIPSTTISNTEPERHTVRISPESDGTYFIGIHCISAKDKYYLYVNNLSLSAAQAFGLPSEPTELKATPAAEGAYSAEISFKAPLTDVSGGALTSLTKAVVSRNGEEIKTFDNPAPGETLRCTDNLPASGEYTYSVAAYNSTGKGLEQSTTVFVGISTPGVPSSIMLKETENLGEVTVSWRAVTKDVNGMTIPSDKVSYTVYMYDKDDLEYYAIESGLTDTSYTFRCLEGSDGQAIVRIGVAARTEGGESKIGTAPLTAVGTPYDGIQESFPHLIESYAWWMGGSCDKTGLFTDNSLASCKSYDLDNGYMFMRGSALEQYGELQSGKVDLSGMRNPGLTFYTYNFVGSNGESDTNEIEVSIKGKDGVFTPVMSSTVAKIAGYNDVAGWSKCYVPLDSYAGEVVEFRITGTIKSFSYVMLDNIRVGSFLNHDLAITSFRVPTEMKAGDGSPVKAGSDYTIEVSLVNNGISDADGWQVDLFAGDERIKTIDGHTIGFDETASVKFDMTMSPIALDAEEYHVVVNFPEDENKDNNTSEHIIVLPIVSRHPAAKDLSVSASASGASLSWTAPSLPAYPEKVVEDFEGADSFAHYHADWSFADLDGLEIAGFKEFAIPGLVNWESKASFFVFEPRRLLLDNQFKAHSGNKYLASLSVWDDTQVDDWAISPELSGNAQTVSFYARSFQSIYPENIEVLYSTGSTDPKDFSIAKPNTQVPGEWTLFEASLPEGAKHFAIRSCGSYNFMLMVDDVAYEAKALGEKYTIAGYNVYRNGERINDSLITSTAHLDTNPADGKNTYVVTTVYNLGESAPSNAVSAEFAGMEDTFLDSETETVYYNLQGIRVANPAKGGIYIRCRGGKSEKVIIK